MYCSHKAIIKHHVVPNQNPSINQIKKTLGFGGPISPWGGQCRKREVQNGEEDEATKRWQIWIERRQIRSTPPPSATSEPRKMKEEDGRLPKSKRRRRCGAESQQIHGGGMKMKPAGEEGRLAGHHHTTFAGYLTGM